MHALYRSLVLFLFILIVAIDVIIVAITVVDFLLLFFLQLKTGSTMILVPPFTFLLLLAAVDDSKNTHLERLFALVSTFENTVIFVSRVLTYAILYLYHFFITLLLSIYYCGLVRYFSSISIG